jgi:hypothetical protein
MTTTRTSEQPQKSPVEAALRAVLADREKELLDLKGPCSTCTLHYAHSGPCDVA